MVKEFVFSLLLGMLLYGMDMFLMFILLYVYVLIIFYRKIYEGYLCVLYDILKVIDLNSDMNIIFIIVFFLNI